MKRNQGTQYRGYANVMLWWSSQYTKRSEAMTRMREEPVVVDVLTAWGTGASDVHVVDSGVLNSPSRPCQNYCNCSHHPPAELDLDLSNGANNRFSRGILRAPGPAN